MADDRLQARADAARVELSERLHAAAPDLETIRERKGSRRQRAAAAAAAVALLAGAVLVASRPEGEATLTAGSTASTAGPEVQRATGGPIAPGEARLLPPSPLSGRSTMASVWTGTEMLIWGGDGERQHDDGAAYEPRRASWRLLPKGPLAPRNAPAAVWTGKEMLLWGGHSKRVAYADGAAFDPAVGTWRRIADAPLRSAGAPQGRWTGTEMLVMVGLNGTDAMAYNPASDTWRRLPGPPGQMTGPEPAVVWTGSHLVAVLLPVGSSEAGIFTLDPAGKTWTELPRLGIGGAMGGGPPSLIRLAWTGDRLLAVAGRTASVLDPGATSWTGVVQLPANVIPGGRFAVWTGRELLLSNSDSEALVIDPVSRTWRATPAGGVKQGEQPAAVWANDALLVWGGFPDVAEGVMLRPSALPGQESPTAAVPLTPAPPPNRIAVSAGSDSGFMDQNGPLVIWNGRTLPVRRVEDEKGNLIGYFGCHFFERSEVERDDFDANASCNWGASSP